MQLVRGDGVGGVAVGAVAARAGEDKAESKGESARLWKEQRTHLKRGSGDTVSRKARAGYREQNATDCAVQHRCSGSPSDAQAGSWDQTCKSSWSVQA